MGNKKAKETEQDRGVVPEQKKRFAKLRELWSTRRGKAIIIGAVLLLIAALLLVVPALRDQTLAQVIKKDIEVAVIDSRTKTPVSGAFVGFGDVTGETNADGIATLEVPSNEQDIIVNKAHYAGVKLAYRVPFFTAPTQQSMTLEATGKVVSLNVSHSITATPLAGVVVSSGDIRSETDDKGMATIVLPYQDEPQTLELASEGYVDSSESYSTTDDKANLALSLTPVGQIQYLSKATGVINVMQANLDGSNARVLVKGSGAENDNSTALLSSRAWRYSALLVSTGSDKQELYLVDATNGQKTLIDKGDKASFDIKGWSNKKFVYVINRGNREYWQDKQQALKVFDAETKKLQTVRESQGNYSDASGYYSNERFNGVYIIHDEIVLVVSWDFGSKYGGQYYGNGNRQAEVVSINPSSLAQNSVKKIDVNPNIFISSKLYEPQGVYLQKVTNWEQDKAVYYEYENGEANEVKGITDSQFNKPYPTYLISPSGEKSFWYEARNGKNTLFIGNKEGAEAKEIAQLSDYKPYAWFGADDEYVLVTKDDSELYIADPNKLADKSYQPLQVTTIHKPDYRYSGYGYGYGGQ